MKNATILFFVAMMALAAGCGELGLGGFSPDAPVNLTAVSGVATNSAGQVLLTWSSSKGTNPSQGATFNIYRSTSATGGLTGKTMIASGITGTTYADTSPPAGTTYYYQVTATIYDKESGGSNEAGIVPQSGGSNNAGTVPQVSNNSTLTLTIVSLNPASNNLSWNAVPAATGYLLYRGITPTGSLSDKTLLKSFDAAAGTTEFSDNTAVTGVTYYYQVSARYAAAPALTSNEIAVSTR